jgi:hypothetical protein
MHHLSRLKWQVVHFYVSEQPNMILPKKRKIFPSSMSVLFLGTGVSTILANRVFNKTFAF